jgi:hypothetical protein
MWALAKLKYRMAPERLSHFLQHVSEHGEHYSPQAIATVLYALACSESVPGDAWLGDVLAAAARSGKVRSMTPQGLTQSMWAAAKLGHAPGGLFAAEALAHMEGRLRQYRSIDLATGLYALARLGLEPRPHALRLFKDATQREMHGLEPHHLSNYVWAFAKMNVQPGQRWAICGVSGLLFFRVLDPT